MAMSWYYYSLWHRDPEMRGVLTKIWEDMPRSKREALIGRISPLMVPELADFSLDRIMEDSSLPTTTPNRLDQLISEMERDTGAIRRLHDEQWEKSKDREVVSIEDARERWLPNYPAYGELGLERLVSGKWEDWSKVADKHELLSAIGMVSERPDSYRLIEWD